MLRTVAMAATDVNGQDRPPVENQGVRRAVEKTLNVNALTSGGPFSGVRQPAWGERDDHHVNALTRNAIRSFRYRTV